MTIYLRPYYSYGMPVSISVQWFQGALVVRDRCVYGHKWDLMGSYSSDFNSLCISKLQSYSKAIILSSHA